MLTAVLFGLAPSSALVIGAAIGARWDLPKKVARDLAPRIYVRDSFVDPACGHAREEGAARK